MLHNVECKQTTTKEIRQASRYGCNIAEASDCTWICGMWVMAACYRMTGGGWHKGRGNARRKRPTERRSRSLWCVKGVLPALTYWRPVWWRATATGPADERAAIGRTCSATAAILPDCRYLSHSPGAEHGQATAADWLSARQSELAGGRLAVGGVTRPSASNPEFGDLLPRPFMVPNSWQ